MIMNFRKKVKNQKGFSLVELMMVIAIIGLMAAISIPKLNASTATAKDGKLKADLRTVDGAVMMYRAAKNAYPADKDAMVNYINAWPTDTAGTDLTYTKGTTDADGYTLTGASSDTTTRKSPGSSDYTVSDNW